MSETEVKQMIFPANQAGPWLPESCPAQLRQQRFEPEVSMS
jgi:hypothetical protein